MNKEINPLKKKNIDWFFLWLLFPLVVYFFFGMQHLAKFETADEHYWLYDSVEGRVHDYWNAVSAKYWLGTRINDKPGITLAYVSGIGLLFEQTNPPRFVKLENSLRQYDPQIVARNNFAFRLPILILNGLLSFFFFWAIWKLTNQKWLSLFATTFILLNPILLGISQIVNPDALLWSFAFSSFLSFQLYLRQVEKKYAFLTAAFLSLALLSKYTAVIFIPFFFALIFFHVWQNSSDWSQEKTKQLLSRYFVAYFGILLGAFFLFALLMPAVFIDPHFLYFGTIGFKGMDIIFALITLISLLLIFTSKLPKGKIISIFLTKTRPLALVLPKLFYAILFLSVFLALFNLSLGENILNVKGLAFDSYKKIFIKQDFYDKYFLEFYPITFSLTPVVLFLMLYAWFKSFFKKIEFGDLLFSLSFFLVSFFLAVFKQELLITIRYTILLYPFIMLISALALWDLLKYFPRVHHLNRMAFIFILVSGIISLQLIAPFYFNYTNNLLPKKRIVTGAWGYGGYEAAQFLNRLPGAENLTAWSDYWGFCPFFKGTCVQGSLLTTVMKKDGQVAIDYYVKSRRGSLSNKNIWNKMKSNTSQMPDWNYAIDGRSKNYISIYKTKNPTYNPYFKTKIEIPEDFIDTEKELEEEGEEKIPPEEIPEEEE